MERFFLILSGINVVTFILFGFDKWMANTGGWRISEKTLWLFSFCGGSIGGFIGMQFFRHKTKKTSFQFMMCLIVIFQIAIVYGVYSLY